MALQWTPTESRLQHKENVFTCYKVKSFVLSLTCGLTHYATKCFKINFFFFSQCVNE